VPSEVNALHLQLSAQFAKVVDLSIVVEDVASIAGAHWLLSRLAQVDDGEPCMSERYAGFLITPGATSIRPAVV
jgi:hypothetical protein